MWACSRRRRGFTCPSPQDTPLLVGICVLLAFAIRIYIEKYFSQFLFKGRGQILLYGFGPFTGQIRRITSNKFGMYDPTPSHHKRLKMDQICKEVLAVSPIYNQILIAVNCNYLSGWTSGGRPNANNHGLLVLTDHLHLRDDHLPLPLLRILLDRAAQVD